MDTKKFFCFNLTAVLIMLLYGCTAQSPAQEPSRAAGHALEELGYTVQVDQAKLPGELDIVSMSVIKTISEADNLDGKITGGYTRGSVYFQYLNGAEELPFMQLQAFQIDKRKDTFILQIGEKSYTNLDLKDVEVFRDDQIIVFNLTPILNDGKNFDQILKANIDELNANIEKAINEPDWPADKSKPALLKYEDYTQLSAVADFYIKNISGMIHKME